MRKFNYLREDQEKLQSLKMVLENSDKYLVTENHTEKTNNKVCFICKVPLGHQHTAGCAFMYKRAKIRITAEYHISVPVYYTKTDIEVDGNKEEEDCKLNNIVDELYDYKQHYTDDSPLSLKYECINDDNEPVLD